MVTPMDFDFKNIRFSKGFIAALLGVLILWFMVRSCSHQKIEFKDKERVSKHQQTVLKIVDQLGIKDENLRQCVRWSVSDRLGKNGLFEIQNLTLLYCPGRNIESLEGIERLIGLRFLDLSDNAIRTITPLQNHFSLRVLKITGNPLEEPGVLKSLANLKSIELPDMPKVSCMDIYRQVGGATHNIGRIKCAGSKEKIVSRKLAPSALSLQPQPAPQENPVAIKSKQKTLSRSQEKELFDYEEGNY